MEEHKRHCPYCGKEIQESARKCRFCGQWLDAGHAATSPSAKRQPDNSGQPNGTLHESPNSPHTETARTVTATGNPESRPENPEAVTENPVSRPRKTGTTPATRDTPSVTPKNSASTPPYPARKTKAVAGWLIGGTLAIAVAIVVVCLWSNRRAVSIEKHPSVLKTMKSGRLASLGMREKSAKAARETPSPSVSTSITPEDTPAAPQKANTSSKPATQPHPSTPSPAATTNKTVQPSTETEKPKTQTTPAFDPAHQAAEQQLRNHRNVQSNQTTKASNEVYTVVEQPPMFPGGMTALEHYIKSHIRYPRVALDREIQGIVTLRFVVLANGVVGDVTVVQGLSPSCDAEAVRVVKSLPRFTPARQEGRPVACWFTLPVRFQID